MALGKPLMSSNLTPQETINAMDEAAAEDDDDGDDDDAGADDVSSLKAATLATGSEVGCGWICL